MIGGNVATKSRGPSPAELVPHRLKRWLDPILLYLLLFSITWVGRYYFTTSGVGFALHHEDDVHYYLKIAQNFSKGFPFTFDQIERTNGFHPLWVAVLTPLCFWFRSPEELVRAAFIFQFLLFIASAIVLFGIVLRVTNGSRLIAFCLSLYFGLDPYFHKTIINGLETPVYVLISLLMIYLGLRQDRSKESGFRTLFWPGLTCGLLILSRLDGGLIHTLGFATAVWLISGRHLPRRAALSGLLACLCPVAIYVLIETLSTGSPWPVSGLTKAALSADGVDHGFLGVLDFPNLYNFDYFSTAIANALPLELITPGSSYHSYYAAPRLVVFSTVLCILTYGLYAVLRFKNLRREPKAMSFITWYSISAFLLLLFNKHLYGYRGDAIPYWYPITFSIAQLLLIAYIFSRITWRPARLVGAALSLVVLVLFVSKSRALHKERKHWLSRHDTYTNWLDTAYWLREHTEPEARVAAYNAGIIGLFSERRVMNLDGLVNSPEFFRRVTRIQRKEPETAKRNLLDMLQSCKIEYFADITPVADPQYWPKAFADERETLHLERQFETTPTGAYAGVVFKIEFASK